MNYYFSCEVDFRRRVALTKALKRTIFHLFKMTNEPHDLKFRHIMSEESEYYRKDMPIIVSFLPIPFD